MTKRRKRRRDPSGYRAQPAAAERTPPDPSASSPGLLGRFLGPPTPAAASAMPLLRTTLGQGFLLVGSSPVLLLVPFGVLLLVWIALLAAGYVGTPMTLASFFAMPPVSTAFDTQLLVAILGQQAGIPVALAFLLLRSVIVAVLAGLIVEGFGRAGAVSSVGLTKGLRAVPVVAASLVLEFAGLLVGQFALLLGPGIGVMLQLFVPALLLYLLGFVPFAAVQVRLGLRETLRVSVTAARTPGGRHLSLSILYVVAAFILPLLIPGRLATANPSFATWVGILLVTFVQLGFTAGFGYRWMAVGSTVIATAEEVPAGAQRR